MENFIYYSVHNITQKAVLYSFPQCQSYAFTQSNFLRNRGLTKAKHLQNRNKQEPVRYRLASVKAAA